MENEVRTCNGCIYYYITWDQRAPKGCKYFGFKSLKMPCQVVRDSSGNFCSMYTRKQEE